MLDIENKKLNTNKLNSKIVDVEAIPIKMPLKRVFKGSNYFMEYRVTVITRITTEDGIVGEIYNGDELDDLDLIVKMIKNEMAPLLIGENIFEVKKIWQKLYPLTFNILADRKIALNALACIDSAVHDTVGKTLGMPLVKLWGGSKEELPVMLIGGYYTEGKDVDEKKIIQDIETYKEMGVAACKFKVGGRSPDVDIERVRIARKAAGDDFILTVDANQGWDRNDALKFALGVRDYNIRWFEEPCRWSYDRDAMKDIRLMSGIPVAAGQSEDSPAACIELMKSGSIDVCNFDASWSGGPTAWKQAAGAAEALGFDMAHHEEPHISAHLLGSTTTGTFLEVFHPDRDPLFYEIIENRNEFKNGFYKIPDGPGFGITLNLSVIEKYRLDK
ncbi:mandelate racemase/muconate lactonizing enzyme family protein [Oceanobacillus alkalisoli]|uniref:mandelate racemase/muconate lactonizing enzyme family protein n=1 Tax=Oceanobacillus alkalisoli TaxID=2925113 RepID=UPI001EE47F14|nr:mandelate racemase/muconate lactonizing enzyme family protein [Oceanobacillus alkalisoli]MCG5102591.1 mandelate racemase/muconate lactonizing enzyme family protein [Oceanobacillus alkalisoli]